MIDIPRRRAFNPARRFGHTTTEETNMRNTIVRLGGLLLAAVALFCFTALPVHAQDGAGTFKAKCAACHGADGKGDNSMGKALKVRDLSSDDVQKQTDAELTTIITDGKGKMPAYKGKLADDQIKQVVAYVRTLKKK
jgi:cytochrome c6